MGQRARIFLGWDKPFLELAVPAWVERVRAAGLEPGKCVVVLPGRRAARRFEERAAELAPADWAPPRVISEGELPQALRRRRAQLASEWQRALAWREALEQVSTEQRSGLWGGIDSVGLAGLARLCARAHAELAAESIGAAAVATAAEAEPVLGSAERWRAYEAAEQRYFAALAQRGVIDPSASAREALDAELDEALHVQLFAVVDPPRALRRLLEGVDVESFVFAPASLAARFDDLGGLVGEAWSEADPGIDSSRWRCVDGPDDQARAVLSHFAGLRPAPAPEQLAVGLADLDVRPFVERRLIEAGCEPRWAGGAPLAASRPAQLVIAGLRWAGTRSADDFALLARHPDFEALCGMPGGALAAALDAYAAEHVPALVDGAWPERRSKAVAQAVPLLTGAVERAQLYFGTREAAQSRCAEDWAAALQALLIGAYPTLDLGARDPLGWHHARALEALARQVVELREAGAAPRPIAATELAELTEQHLDAIELPPHPASGAAPVVELFGWLELALDDAPQLALCGLNEGSLPSRGSSGGFLGEPARKRLGLVDERRRVARDVWALSAILASRPQALLLTGRRTAERDPLAPSRLLFRASDAETLARVRQAFPDHESDLPAPEGQPEPYVPAVPKCPLPDEISVTGFKTYLQSPYQYYLLHVLRRSTAPGGALELDPLAFGSLAHDVVRVLGEPALRVCKDAVKLEQALLAELESQARARFGGVARPAVLLQIEKLRERLRVLARWQARDAADGWQIEQAEFAAPPRERTGLRVKGRIDRLDYNVKLGCWRVVDYKTGDSAATPRSAHLRGGEWQDLQLPLYRWLTEELRAQRPGKLQLGYINISKSDSDELFCEFELDESTYASALARADEVIEAIRRREFGALGEAMPYDPSLAAVCGFGLLADSAAEEEMPE